MSMCRMAAFLAGFLLVAMFASAVSRNTIQIKVLDSETRALPLDDNGVPLNCEQLTFDAYCRSTRAPQVTSTLLVQEGNNPPFHIICTIESRYSRCTPLSKGETFEARRGKHGITVYYVDDKGKARSQLYKYVDKDGKPGPSASAAVVANQRIPAVAESAGQPRAAAVAAPAQYASAPVPPPAPAPSGLAEKATREKVRCNFTSTPPDADITVDGSYVGNTPSEIGLTTGKHLVVIAKVGFGEWKRELTVSSDSVVNVTANLQQSQP